MPIQVILLLFARFAKFLLHVVQFILLWCIKQQVTLPHCEFVYILRLTITMWPAVVVQSHTFCGINLCMRLLGEHPNQLPCQQALISQETNSIANMERNHCLYLTLTYTKWCTNLRVLQALQHTIMFACKSGVTDGVCKLRITTCWSFVQENKISDEEKQGDKVFFSKISKVGLGLGVDLVQKMQPCGHL